MHEAIFIAATTAEAERIERLLEAEGIDFELTPEPFVQGLLSGSCALGLLFEVPSGEAERCRRLLTDAGLGRGIVP
jgi:hypothetical protein